MGNGFQRTVRRFALSVASALAYARSEFQVRGRQPCIGSFGTASSASAATVRARFARLVLIGSLQVLLPFAASGGAQAPSRVVTLAPSLTEIVFALGAGDRLVGVSSYCDYPEQAVAIDRVGTFLQPNVEVILKKHPDLVFAVPSPENRSAVGTLRDLGVRVRVVRPGRLASVLEAIEVIATDLDREDAGRRLVFDIRHDVAAVRARLAGVQKRRVLMVVGRRPLIAVGGGTYQSELIEMAGGANIVGDSSEAWPQVSLEYVIARAPEVIIDSGMGPRDRAGDIADYWGAFPTIPAVRDHRVVGSGRYDLLRAGPRAGEALEAMARFIHPEVFAGVPAGLLPAVAGTLPGDAAD